MSKVYKITDYKPLLNPQETEQGIKKIKDFFQQNLATGLKLRRVTGPLFVLRGTGINDDLNGVERPVTCPIKDLGDQQAEVVHSLAKWKRLTLAEYNIQPGYGIYTDMNAIRADEELDNLHSLYVDQWDWERVITAEQRTVDYLKAIVRDIYAAMLRTEFMVCEAYPQIQPFLPSDIYFIHAEELRKMYPDLTPKERENAITEAKGAVFIIGIGCELGDGKPHDGRAPDYDDWELNGDILFWFEPLQCALELSSMGIRVSEESLEEQLAKAHCTDRKKLPYHKALLTGKLPYTIGGGIGQSRLCMLLLGRCHVGEVQASIWPKEMREECAKRGVHLL